MELEFPGTTRMSPKAMRYTLIINGQQIEIASAEHSYTNIMLRVDDRENGTVLSSLSFIGPSAKKLFQILLENEVKRLADLP